MFDTIAAISTGVINQPISLIRLSGPEAFSITKKIFSGKEGKDKTITYGWIKDGNKKIDEVLVSWFVGPKTFTGENVVEINAHGGVVNTNKILKLLLANGARLAERGEFSRRAFLNGKMDLIKADAIHDLIFAKTEEQAQLSVKKFDSETSNLITKLQNKLANLIAILETNIDYPEYDDIEVISENSIVPKLEEIKKEIFEIQEHSKSSRFIFDGVNVAIVGKPNVGKSSLLNAFLNEEKAIVSNVPGTTRDVVEGKIQVGQVLLNFKDTAGVHESKDKIENMGITKTIQEIDNADLVIHVIDINSKEDNDDKYIKEHSKNKTYIKVFNKTENIKKENNINVIAKDKNIIELTKAIKNIFKDINLDNEKVLNNTRQLSLIDKTLISIKNALQSIKNKQTVDVIILDIREAWEQLANILGQANDEDLLDHMFKNFCLGK